MTQPQFAVDNDVVLKVASYGLGSIVWPGHGREIGVLVAARFVVASAIARGRGRNKARAQTELARLLESATQLEPTPAEVEAALTLELAAQGARLPLDPGESLLCAIVVARALNFLQTGDKRAVRSLELLLEDVKELAELCGRVISLEQAMLGAVEDEESFHTTAAALCAEPDVDKALSICFGCYGSPAARDEVTARLGSYIKDLRAAAPRMLAPA